jgi:hypothetical protein
MVATLLLAESQSAAAEAAALFTEARDVGLRELQVHPVTHSSASRSRLPRRGWSAPRSHAAGPFAERATPMLQQSAANWREVLSRSAGDARSAEELARIETLLAKGR